jgi:hypothetical protein
MTVLNSSTAVDSQPSQMPSGTIPVLSTVIPEVAVPQDLREALDMLEQNKADWMAMESHLLQTLRPEMERLTTELVRTGLREVWRKRSNPLG